MLQTWLTPTFWEETITRTLSWIITTIPSVLFILLLAIVALKALSMILHRIKKAMLASLQDNPTDSTEQEKRIETLMGILTSSTRLVLGIMVAMLVLRKIGIDIAPLIAGAGIVGLAVGFGAQELVRDVISGFFMLFENQVRAGDVAIVNGTGGSVEKVGLRTIILRDLSGVVHVFQNGKINTLSNMTKEWSAMVFDIGVAYKEDTDIVVAIMQEIAQEMQGEPAFGASILEPIEVFGVDNFGASAVVVKARLKTKPIKQWEVGREYRRRLKKAFDARRIEIPFPHQTIYWGNKIDPLRVDVTSATSE